MASTNCPLFSRQSGRTKAKFDFAQDAEHQKQNRGAQTDLALMQNDRVRSEIEHHKGKGKKQMSNQKLDGVRGVYDAFARGDVPGVLAFLASDIEWTEADGFPYAGTYRGPNAVLDGVFMRLGTEWEGYAAVPDEFIDAGDTVVVLGKYSGKYKATGKSFQANFAHVWKLRDGKAVKFVQYTDTQKVHEAL